MQTDPPSASSQGRRAAWRSKVRLALAVLVAALALAEVGLRVAGVEGQPRPLRFRFTNRMDADADEHASLFRFSPTLFWEPRPGAQLPGFDERIGPHGMRGTPPPERVPGALRLAALGDSCTFGMGVAGDQTYAAVLEALLRQRHPDRAISVLNGGVPGYTLAQGARFFEERVQAFEPDIVVLYHGVWNDYNAAMGQGDVELAAARQQLQRPIDRLYALALHSRLIQLVATRYSGTLRHRHWRATVDEWMRGEPSGGYRVGIAQFRDLLHGFLDRCTESGRRVVVILPELDAVRAAEQPIQLERLERYRRALQDAADARDLPVVDLRAVLAGLPHEQAFLDMIHPTAQGYARLAQALFEAIEARGWCD